MTKTSLTDTEIIKKTLEDSAYFEYIIDRYEAKLLNYIMRSLDIYYEDAENILQEIFIKVYKNLNEFNPSLSFGSWIYRISHNHIIDYYRKNSKIEKFSIDDEAYSLLIENIKSELNPLVDLSRKETKEIVTKALQSIKKEYREILVLKFLEDKSYEEIGDILRMPIWTVGTLVNRAKTQIKEELSKLKFNY